jgi:hypothetical protein
MLEDPHPHLKACLMSEDWTQSIGFVEGFGYLRTPRGKRSSGSSCSLPRRISFLFARKLSSKARKEGRKADQFKDSRWLNRRLADRRGMAPGASISG